MARDTGIKPPDDPNADAGGESIRPDSRGGVRIDDRFVRLDGLVIDDPTVVAVLSRLGESELTDAVTRMVGIGARAMVETAIGVDLAAVDERVLHTIEKATAAAEHKVRTIVGEAELAMRASLDPDTRTSAMARAITEFESVRTSIIDTVDPTRSDSHVSVLLRAITALLGPGGELESRLSAALDPASEDSGLAALRRDVERHFTELRESIAERRGRRAEAELGTRKGFDFEDVVEDRLRTIARPAGAVVERTSDRSGCVGGDLVGDFVVTLQSGASIVVEAKNSVRVGLNGPGGILAELDLAMANRGAAMAICVSAGDAFPAEVGVFGVYGNRILAVDDGEGSMLEVAFRWAGLLAAASEKSDVAVDLDALTALSDRIRRMAQTFSNHRRALTDSIASIDKVRDGLKEMRRDLLAHIDEMDFELEGRPGTRPLRVVGSD
jgi:hypothetical protein